MNMNLTDEFAAVWKKMKPKRIKRSLEVNSIENQFSFQLKTLFFIFLTKNKSKIKCHNIDTEVVETEDGCTHRVVAADATLTQ